MEKEGQWVGIGSYHICPVYHYYNEIYYNVNIMTYLWKILNKEQGSKYNAIPMRKKLKERLSDKTENKTIT